MSKIVINWIFKTVVGRWVTASLIALLLSGGAWKWHAFKEDLIHKGQQVCVQEINKQTVIDLEDALAAQIVTQAELVNQLRLVALENALAVDRRLELETSITALAIEMEEQRELDPNYKAWSDTALPTGVAGRLRNQASGSDPDTGNEDSN